MATRTKIVGDTTLQFVFNVSSPVGPGQPNLADDVELCSVLIRDLLSNPTPQTSQRVKSPIPDITRTFNLTLGFWIYELQFVLGSSGTSDGVASPVKGPGVSFQAGKLWVLGAINQQVKKRVPAIFNGYPSDARLSQTLRTAIRG